MAFPLTSTWNVPGCASGTQSFVRTQTRYEPASGTVTCVTASRTGVPMPCASRYADPISSTNWDSSTQPP